MPLFPTMAALAAFGGADPEGQPYDDETEPLAPGDVLIPGNGGPRRVRTAFNEFQAGQAPAQQPAAAELTSPPAGLRTSFVQKGQGQDPALGVEPFGQGGGYQGPPPDPMRQLLLAKIRRNPNSLSTTRWVQTPDGDVPTQEAAGLGLLNALSGYDANRAQSRLADAQGMAQLGMVPVEQARADAAQAQAAASIAEANARTRHQGNEDAYLGQKQQYAVTPAQLDPNGQPVPRTIGPAEANIALSDPRYDGIRQRIVGPLDPQGQPVQSMGQRIADLASSGLLDDPLLGPYIKSAFQAQWGPKMDDVARGGSETMWHALGFDPTGYNNVTALLKKHYPGLPFAPVQESAPVSFDSLGSY